MGEIDMANVGSQILKAKVPAITTSDSLENPIAVLKSATKALDSVANPPSHSTSAQTLESLDHPSAKGAHSRGHNERSASPHPNIQSQGVVWIDGQAILGEQDLQADQYSRAAEFNPSNTMTVAHTRRNANGTVGSVYSGNKIRHLKKEDGQPLWRKDIQLQFLQFVFDDDKRCFTMASDGSKDHTFAETYIDAMARSSKTSKVLKEKLLADRAGAMSMAMICLLVNVGRMNTTLNFFPEMRAQLRTFHAIPSLQANQDPNAYKQLQDAPRLKSILKGASEDLNQPTTIEKIKTTPVPRTNPVHLIFVLSQHAPKISEDHFHPPRDFFDLVMRGTLSSKSRARAFLWLIWWYLESDFSAEAAMNNPYGPGQAGEGIDGIAMKVPAFEHLTEIQAEEENVDTESEKQYGELKRLERRRILEEDETVGPPLKKQKKGGADDGVIAISDTDPTRTPSPSSAIQRKASTDHAAVPFPGPTSLNDSRALQRYSNIASKTNSANPHPLFLKTKLDQPLSSSPPVPPGSAHPTLSAISNGHRRPRPETSHQKAVNINRKMRIDHILHKQMLTHQIEVRRHKRRNSSSFGMMVLNRVKDLPESYDTDDESSWGPGGLVANKNETDDYGDQSVKYKKVIDRAMRRLQRSESAGSGGGFVRAYNKRRRRSRDYDDEGLDQGRYEGPTPGKHRHPSDSTKSHKGTHYDDQLDDLDLALLGENRDGYQEYESGSESYDGEETEEDVGIHA